MVQGPRRNKTVLTALNGLTCMSRWAESFLMVAVDGWDVYLLVSL